MLYRTVMQRAWAPLALVVLVVLTAVIFVVWRSPPADANEQAVPAANTGLAPVRPTAEGTAPATELAAASGAIASPSGVTAEQWQSLRDSLADHPDRDRELARIAAYFEYRHAVQALRSPLRDAANTNALRDAARRVDAGLADRIAQGEVTAGEALALKQAALEVLQPDSAQRALAIEQWRTAQLSAPSTTPIAGDDAARNILFRERQATLVTTHRALPASQRDAAKLAAQLQALRTEIFDAPASDPALPSAQPPTRTPGSQR
jgi:hypothetical protein